MRYLLSLTIASIAAAIFCGVAWANVLQMWQAETMFSDDGDITVASDANSQDGLMLRWTGAGEATKTLTTTTAGDHIVVRAKAVLFNGTGGELYLKVNGTEVTGSRGKINSTTYADYSFPATVPAGATVTVGSALNSSGREVHVDNVSVEGTPASDTTPPTTTIDSGPTGGATDTDGNVSYTFSSNEADSTFECKLDDPVQSGETFMPCTSPKAYSNLPEGSYTFEVRATDAAGNVDATPASATFVVDTTPAPSDYSFEGESMSESDGDISIVTPDAGSSGGAYLKWSGAGVATKTTATSVAETEIVVKAKGVTFNSLGMQMTVTVNGGSPVYQQRVSNTTYQDISIPAAVPAGASIEITAGLGGSGRELHIDKVTIPGATEPPPGGNGLEINGLTWTMNGQPFKMYGVRVASGSQNSTNTSALISNLDDYKAHGVNTIAVYYMGSSGGNSDPFESDGSGGVRLEADDAQRMRQIIEAADQREMAVVVGIFYQHAPFSSTQGGSFDSTADVQQAIDVVVDELQPYSNVILNIANEQNSSGYSNNSEPGNIQSATQLNSYIDRAHDRAASNSQALPVGGGGYNDANNITIGNNAKTDVLLFDTGGYEFDFEHSGTKYDEYSTGGVDDKPVVNVEMFGGWTLNCHHPSFPSSDCTTAGVYTTDAKNLHYIDVDDAAAEPGLSVFFHSNRWIQGGTTHFNLGGQGTSLDKGMHWWFDYVQANG